MNDHEPTPPLGDLILWVVGVCLFVFAMIVFDAGLESLFG